MNRQRIRQLFVHATAWGMSEDVDLHMEELREKNAADFDAWLDGELRAARVEALREAANAAEPDFPIEVALGGSDYVHVWLHARANQIENGADQ